MATTKTKPNLDLFELILDETVEVCQRLERPRSNLRGLKRGSDAYYDVMAEIAVAAGVMNVKTESLVREDDATIDAMPDDDWLFHGRTLADGSTGVSPVQRMGRMPIVRTTDE